VSAAKQAGIKYDPQRLRAAVISTARFLPGVEARAQGHGLIQVNDAWAALQIESHWEPSRFVTQATIVNAEGITLRKDGRGLFEMSGWTPDSKGRREITVTRTEGPVNSVNYRLSWQGDTGVFSSPVDEVALPLNKPVKIPVDIVVTEAGSYSAILNLVDPQVQLIAHSVMATIFVALPLTPENQFKVAISKSSSRQRVLTYVSVPTGLSGMMVHFKRGSGLAGSFSAQDPAERVLPYYVFGSEFKPEPASDAGKGEQTQFFDHPAPGVWQFTLQLDGVGIKQENGEDSPVADYSLEFTGYELEGSPIDLASISKTRTIGFENRSGAELTTEAIGLGMGSERDAVIDLKPGFNAHLSQVDIVDGTKRFEIEMKFDDPSSRVGLYVYKVPTGPGKVFGDPKAVSDATGLVYATALIYKDSSNSIDKRLSLESPMPGRYIIAVDPIQIPVLGLKVHYRDVLIHPTFGEMSCTSSLSTPSLLTSKSAQLDWTIRARPVDDRFLVAECAMENPTIGYSALTESKDKPDDEQLRIVPVPLATQIVPISP
jgi:hypothetical protein